MSFTCKYHHKHRAKIQRSVGRMNLGACIALSAEDLSFVKYEDLILIKKTKTEHGLVIEIAAISVLIPPSTSKRR